MRETRGGEKDCLIWFEVWLAIHDTLQFFLYRLIFFIFSFKNIVITKKKKFSGTVQLYSNFKYDFISSCLFPSITWIALMTGIYLPISN